jgi:hypothetical protein
VRGRMVIIGRAVGFNPFRKRLRSAAPARI